MINILSVNYDALGCVLTRTDVIFVCATYKNIKVYEIVLTCSQSSGNVFMQHYFNNKIKIKISKTEMMCLLHRYQQHHQCYQTRYRSFGIVLLSSWFINSISSQLQPIREDGVKKIGLKNYEASIHQTKTIEF